MIEGNLFDLSEKVQTYHGWYIIQVPDVKEFIKRQIDRIDLRLEFLSDFHGLIEAELQMRELRKVKNDLLKDAGEKLQINSQQVSGRLASVEETKQSGLACNSAGKKLNQEKEK